MLTGSTMTALMGHLENAQSALVQAAKLAHCQRHPEAKNLSKLINSLEDIDQRLFEKSSFKTTP